MCVSIAAGEGSLQELLGVVDSTNPPAEKRRMPSLTRKKECTTSIVSCLLVSSFRSLHCDQSFGGCEESNYTHTHTLTQEEHFVEGQ